MADLWCYKVSPGDISLPILGFYCFMHRGVFINVEWMSFGIWIRSDLNQYLFTSISMHSTYNLVQNKQILHERLREFSDADFGAKIRSWMFRLGNRKYPYHLLFVVIRDGVSYVYYKSTMALHHVYLEIQSNSFSKTNWKLFQ